MMSAMLRVVDPSVTLLAPSDASRCLHRFLGNAASSISRDPAGVAASYREAFGKLVTTTASTEDVLMALSDPWSSLRDDDACDAAILHVCTQVGVTLVLQKDGACGVCKLFPPRAGADDAAVVVTYSSDGYELRHERAPLSTIRRWLCAEVMSLSSDAAAVRKTLDAVGRDNCKTTRLAELEALAERLAVGGGGGRMTKARLVGALRSCTPVKKTYSCAHL